MIRIFRILCLVIAVPSVVEYTQSTKRAEGVAAAPHTPDSGSVSFDIAPLPGSNGTTQWMATYSSQGKTAKFRIEFGPAKTSGDLKHTDFPVSFGRGQIVAEPASDANVLLADLKKALEAKKLPSNVQRMRSLPFAFATIGENLSQASGGGFHTKPPGHWGATKIFLGEGEQEGEVFLNINSVLNKGQFSIKDADYGDIVLSQLAKVL
jgi:hypothetical protein